MRRNDDIESTYSRIFPKSQNNLVQADYKSQARLVAWCFLGKAAIVLIKIQFPLSP